MNQKIWEVMELVRCSLKDEAPAPKEGRDWEEIFGLAAKAKLEPFVWHALKLGKGLDCPAGQYQELMQRLQKKAVGRVIAAGELARLQEELQRLGAQTAVVKGQAAAAAYPHPELRGGCDIDLYVAKEKEALVYDWAKEQGCRQERRVPGTHHGKITHPVLGLIELHVSFCNADEALVESAKAKDGLLRHPTEPFCTLDNCGSPVVTIGMTDHMLFLLGHMVNHYLHGEAQARMLLDLNVFFDRYREEMEERRLEDVLERLRYRRFLGAVLFLGNEYLGFSHEEKWTRGVSHGEAEELLEGLFQGDLAKEEALLVYDEYCKGTVPGGVRGLAFKLRVLGTNVRTAFQLRHQMSFGTMAAMGLRRVKNMFSPSGKTGRETGGNGEARQRVGLLKKLGMMD